MTDNEIIKVNESNSVIQREKIKAIYPHIVVSGKKPYYSIHWYDVKQQKMICGFSSYKLNFVRKWLQEEFEVVDDDIENLINRQKAENERLKAENKSAIDDLKHCMYFAKPKNSNTCNFCSHDGEGGRCRGRENRIECNPIWRGLEKEMVSEDK